MTDALTGARTAMNPVRARAKVLARADRELRAELVRLRRAAGLSQKDVADRMGISQQAVYKLERYDADPRQSTLQRYANAVGAIIEHRVSVDRGQSVRLANSAGWATARRGPFQAVAGGARTGRSAVNGWSTAAPIGGRR